MCVLREFQGWNKAALFHYLPSGCGVIQFYSSSYLKNQNKTTLQRNSSCLSPPKSRVADLRSYPRSTLPQGHAWVLPGPAATHAGASGCPPSAAG